MDSRNNYVHLSTRLTHSVGESADQTTYLTRICAPYSGVCRPLAAKSGAEAFFFILCVCCLRGLVIFCKCCCEIGCECCNSGLTNANAFHVGEDVTRSESFNAEEAVQYSRGASSITQPAKQYV